MIRKNMKKNFKMYFLIWLVMVIAFNAISFIIRQNLPLDSNAYNNNFFITLVFVNVSFLVNLICAHYAFDSKNINKLFYNVPLITISWSLLIVSVVVGLVFMFNPSIQLWIPLIIYIIIIAISLISITSAKWASDTIEEIDYKVKTQTSFINNLTNEAKHIIDNCQNNELKNECRKLYENIRYSDPISNDNLFDIENIISIKLNELANLVKENTVVNAKEKIDELNRLIKERNDNCKRLK